MVEMPRSESFREATEIAPEVPAPAAAATKRNVFKRAAVVLALLATTVGGAYFGYEYFTYGRYLESTDDAYVKADSTIVAPKVSGYIAQVVVGDNERVKPGQLLAKIDDRDYRAALNQAHADVAAADATVRNLNAQIELQQPLIQQQAAAVEATEAALKFAQEEQARYDGLMKTGSGTIQRAQQTDAALREKTAQLQRDKSGLNAANAKVEVLATERT
jgi:membrane fusion protein (multidrug efflux system)